MELLMATDLQTRLYTTGELLAMPEDGMDRWLIRGQLREKPMTRRNRFHSRIMVRIAYLLETWLENQPKPRGEALCGEAGCWLRRDPDTTVGIDVAYFAPDVVKKQTDDTTIVDGAPVLAV